MKISCKLQVVSYKQTHLVSLFKGEQKNSNFIYMKISIITPSYNHAEFLEKTLISVLSQIGSFELEYIVIDGGSTDNSQEILKKYDRLIKDKKWDTKCKNIDFIWKSEKDNGQSDAINKGLKIATGNVIGWLNSDDTYKQNALETVIRFFAREPEIIWAFGKCHIINKEDKEIRKWITAYKNLRLRNFNYDKLLEENFISQPATFWRKKVMDEIGYLDKDHHLVMDYEYWLRLGAKFKGGFINNYLANFRWYVSSKSGGGFLQQFKQDLEVAKKYAKGRKWPIFLHNINHYKIITIYSIMSLFRRKK